MVTLRQLSRFRKDYKRCLKRGYDMKKLHGTIEALMQGKILGPQYIGHSLLGEYKDCRECHIEPDWLLIYLFTETELVLVRTGTHADLFE
jgi:mRNA interferase YafQ